MDRGFREVVLSGIHLGQYGGDLDPVVRLETLLSRFLNHEMPGRLRLSSIEPLEITPHLVSLITAADGRICRHLHIPLQSGSDRILAAMGRPYKRDQFAEAVDTLTGSVPGIGIGCDVICGFPGETSEDFQQTFDLIKQFKVPFIHAFPFSPRPGTVAGSMKDNVPHHVKKDRVAELRALARENRRFFARSFDSHVLETVLENRTDDRGRTMSLSDNYLQTSIENPGVDTSPGRIVKVRIHRVEDDLLVGRMDSRFQIQNPGKLDIVG
jgi:threonylcarbamoyladenosine tRNA methylthiotransferase MtaB